MILNAHLKHRKEKMEKFLFGYMDYDFCLMDKLFNLNVLLIYPG